MQLATSGEQGDVAADKLGVGVVRAEGGIENC